MLKKAKLQIGLVFLLGVLTPQQVFAVNIGPFKVAKPFCEKIQQLAPILNVYTNIQWPVVGVPGITMGLASNTSALLDFCNFIMQIEQLSTQNAIFFAGNKLNELTDNKWNHHLNMADKTWNLANSLYDFENGAMRKGTLTSVSTHREMNDYMNTSYSWYHKTFNGTDAQLKNRGQREGEMNQFARSAYRRAILAEAVNCPAVKKNVNYNTIYNTKIVPHQKKIEEAKEDLFFFKEKLFAMGPKFMSDQDQLNEYIKDIEKLETQGVSYRVRVVPKNETTSKPGAVDPSTGKPQRVDTKITRDTQEWTAHEDSQMFKEFQAKWNPLWQSYVQTQFIKDTRGILVNNANEKVQREFRDLNFECNPRRLMRGIPTTSDTYEQQRDEKVEECRNSQQANEKRTANLIDTFSNELAKSLRMLKDSTAAIWTVESIEFNATRSVSASDGKKGFQQEEVACSETLTPAEMQQLANKQQSVNIELAEQQTKQLLKQTTMMSMEAESNALSAEENNKRLRFAEQQGKRAAESVSNTLEPVAVEGGLR